MTYQRAAFFPHRRNPDGSLTLICLTCCSTFASHKTEEELVELDRKHIGETAVLAQRVTWSLSTEIREWSQRCEKPKVGDRVAIPNHALVFIIKSLDETRKTVEARADLPPENSTGGSWSSLVIDLHRPLLNAINSATHRGISV